MRAAFIIFASAMLGACSTPASVPREFWMDTPCMGTPAVPDETAALMITRTLGAKLSVATLSHGIWAVMSRNRAFGYYIAQCDGSVVGVLVTGS